MKFANGKNNMETDETKLGRAGTFDTAHQTTRDKAAHSTNPMDASADMSWLAPNARPIDHASAVARLRKMVKDTSTAKRRGPALREHRAAFDVPVPVRRPDPNTRWRMDGCEPSPLPPPINLRRAKSGNEGGILLSAPGSTAWAESTTMGQRPDGMVWEAATSLQLQPG